MQAVSDRFLEEVRGSHTPAYSVTIDGAELPVKDGSVTLNAQGATRASLSLTLAVAEWELEDYVPDDLGDLLAPAGGEIIVKRGIEYADGTTELVPLGVFRIDETDGDDSGDDLPLQISALDRSARIIEAVFEKAGYTAAGETVEDEIERVVSEGFPSCTFNLLETGVTLPLITYEAGDDRWDYCQALAEAAGCILYFDAEGTLVLRNLTQTNTAALDIVEGEDGTLLGIGKRISRENACNRVVVRGETSTEDPVIGEKVDDDPTSPTYYYGDTEGFGKVTFEWSSSYIIDADQANDVAQNILNQRLGLGQEIRFESIVNPALEPYDTVKVTRERLKVVEELHIIDSIQIPLTSSSPAMSCTTRLARVF